MPHSAESMYGSTNVIDAIIPMEQRNAIAIQGFSGSTSGPLAASTGDSDSGYSFCFLIVSYAAFRASDCVFFQPLLLRSFNHYIAVLGSRWGRQSVFVLHFSGYLIVFVLQAFLSLTVFWILSEEEVLKIRILITTHTEHGDHRSCRDELKITVTLRERKFTHSI